MAGFAAGNGSGATTPGRKTHVRFDLAETVVVEPAWSVFASGDDIQFGAYSVGDRPAEISYGGTPKSGQTQGVARLSTGYIGLSPRVLDLAGLHTRTPEQSDILDLTKWHGMTDLVERPLWKSPDAASHPGLLTGAAADLAAVADRFLTITRRAGLTWVTDLSLEPLDPPPGPAPVIARPAAFQVDAIAQTTAIYPPDQGYQLRWRIAGTNLDEHDVLFAFEFGGPLSPQWHGRFALAFGMDGRVRLSELSYRESDQSYQWVMRDEWAYAAKQDVVGPAHWFIIIPHARRYLEFQGRVRDVVRALALTSGGLGAPRVSAEAHHYQVPEVHVEAKRAAGGAAAIQTFFVTGAGAPSLWASRNLRPQIQVALLRYPEEAERLSQIVDAPRPIPWGSTATALLRTWYEGTLPLESSTIYASPAITCSLIDHGAGQALGPPYDIAGGQQAFNLPGGANQVGVRYKFLPGGPVADIGAWSPWLLAYELRKPAVTASAAPGELEGGDLRAVSITSADADPSHETAEVLLMDPRNELSRLRTRGRMPVLIETEYDGNPATRSRLLQGYLARATAMLRGRTGERQPGVTLPYTERHDLTVLCVGQWARLAETLWLGHLIDFAGLVDPTDITAGAGDPNQPAKITDAVRELLGYAGYPETQIDVPDINFRFWIGRGTDKALYQLQPGQSIGEFLRQILTQYMGAYLYWDANAGDDGMWRLQTGPRAGTLRATFRTTTPTSVEPSLVNAPGLWGADTTFIRKDTLRTYVIPPEANAVWVTTTGETLPDGNPVGRPGWAANPKSVNLPYFGGNTADPNHPDYIGRLIVRPIYDPELLTPQAVAFACRRYYDITCRARKVAEWTAPLLLIDDADAVYAGRKRPLRYGDTVAIDATQYLLTSVNPDLGPTKDDHMFAYYEGEEIVT